MTMEIISTFVNSAVDFTTSAIVLILSIFALLAVWKWLIGLCIKFVHWLCPTLSKHKQNGASNKEA